MSPRSSSKCATNIAKVKQGRQSDADRAKTEFDNRRIDHIEAEAKIKTVSARLAELLNIDPTIRLHPAEERLVPFAVVPDPIPLPELLAIAMMQRPELAERRVAIRQAFLELSAAKVLPFSPNVIIGLSGGVFGGGSNSPRPSRALALSTTATIWTWSSTGPCKTWAWATWT